MQLVHEPVVGVEFWPLFGVAGDLAVEQLEQVLEKHAVPRRVGRQFAPDLHGTEDLREGHTGVLDLTDRDELRAVLEALCDLGGREVVPERKAQDSRLVRGKGQESRPVTEVTLLVHRGRADEFLELDQVLPPAPGLAFFDAVGKQREAHAIPGPEHGGHRAAFRAASSVVEFVGHELQPPGPKGPHQARTVRFPREVQFQTAPALEFPAYDLDIDPVPLVECGPRDDGPLSTGATPQVGTLAPGDRSAPGGLEVSALAGLDPKTLKDGSVRTPSTRDLSEETEAAQAIEECREPRDRFPLDPQVGAFVVAREARAGVDDRGEGSVGLARRVEEFPAHAAHLLGSIEERRTGGKGFLEGREEFVQLVPPGPGALRFRPGTAARVDGLDAAPHRVQKGLPRGGPSLEVEGSVEVHSRQGCGHRSRFAEPARRQQRVSEPMELIRPGGLPEGACEIDDPGQALVPGPAPPIDGQGRERPEPLLDPETKLGCREPCPSLERASSDSVPHPFAAARQEPEGQGRGTMVQEQFGPQAIPFGPGACGEGQLELERRGVIRGSSQAQANHEGLDLLIGQVALPQEPQAPGVAGAGLFAEVEGEFDLGCPNRELDPIGGHNLRIVDPLQEYREGIPGAVIELQIACQGLAEERALPTVPRQGQGPALEYEGSTHVPTLGGVEREPVLGPGKFGIELGRAFEALGTLGAFEASREVLRRGVQWIQFERPPVGRQGLDPQQVLQHAVVEHAPGGHPLRLEQHRAPGGLEGQGPGFPVPQPIEEAGFREGLRGQGVNRGDPGRANGGAREDQSKGDQPEPREAPRPQPASASNGLGGSPRTGGRSGGRGGPGRRLRPGLGGRPRRGSGPFVWRAGFDHGAHPTLRAWAAAQKRAFPTPHRLHFIGRKGPRPRTGRPPEAPRPPPSPPIAIAPGGPAGVALSLPALPRLAGRGRPDQTGAMELRRSTWLLLSLLVATLGWSPAEGSESRGEVRAPFEIEQGRRKKGKQDPGPTRVVPFAGTIAQAQRAALERNVPILLIAMVDGEPQNDEQRNMVLGSGDLLEARDRFLLVLCNNGSHDRVATEVAIDEEGEPIVQELCKHVLTPTCKQHQEAMDEAFNTWHDNGNFGCPHVLVLHPDGTVIKRHVTQDPIGIKTIMKSLAKATEELGPGLGIDELRQVRLGLDKGRIALKAKEFGEAHGHYGAVLAITGAPLYADPATQGQEDAVAGMEAYRDGAVASLEAGDVRAGWTRLRKLERDWSETEYAKGLKRLASAWKKDKRTKEAIAALEHEFEADDLLDEAQRLLDEDQRKRAESKLKIILRKYEGTPAAELVKERFPELVR